MSIKIVNIMCDGINFVKRIDDILKENNLSRKDLCEAIEINPSTMATWKTRNILPPVETVAKVADKLGVSIEWLLTGSPYKASDFERGKLSRKIIRERIYKLLATKLGNESSTDDKTNHLVFFTNMPKITYEVLNNWAKGYINLDSYIFEDIALSLGISVEYLLMGNEYNKQYGSFDNSVDQNIYETATRNLNDLFCLDNLTGDRKQSAHIMLNQFMKLEHLEYVEKNKNNPQ